MCGDVTFYIAINIQQTQIMAHQVGRAIASTIITVISADKPGTENTISGIGTHTLDPAEEDLIKLILESSNSTVKSYLKIIRKTKGVKDIIFNEGDLPGTTLGRNEISPGRAGEDFGICIPQPFVCIDKITIDREKIQEAGIAKVGATASDTIRKQAQLLVLGEIIAHEICHSKLWPDGNDKVSGFPARGTRPYYGKTLGDCEQKLFKKAFGQKSPSWKKAILRVPWDPSLSPTLKSILKSHPHYFSSVNAAVKAQGFTPTRYRTRWSPHRK